MRTNNLGLFTVGGFKSDHGTSLLKTVVKIMYINNAKNIPSNEQNQPKHSSYTKKKKTMQKYKILLAHFDWIDKQEARKIG